MVGMTTCAVSCASERRLGDISGGLREAPNHLPQLTRMNEIGLINGRATQHHNTNTRPTS
jgi:hypothetical protein